MLCLEFLIWSYAMNFLIQLKAREKFVSLKKNTRGDIVAELEEVLAIYFIYVNIQEKSPYPYSGMHKLYMCTI